jgi:hypothetical protein
MSGERKRRKQYQEMGLEKEQNDKEIRLEERGERSEADLLAKREGWTLAGTTTRQKMGIFSHFLTAGNARKCFAHQPAFRVFILMTAVHSQLIE